MKAVITVIGKDMVGILAKVSSICAEKNVNVIEVTQSILQDMFCMIMMADVSDCSVPFAEFSDILSEYGKENLCFNRIILKALLHKSFRFLTLQVRWNNALSPVILF